MSQKTEQTDVVEPDLAEVANTATTPEPSGLLAGLRFFLQNIIDRNLTQIASSLTYTSILALVPLLTVILSLFTAFPLFDDFRVALEKFLTSSLMPAAVSDTVMGYLNQFAAKASSLTAVGSLFLIVTSLMLISTIDQAFNDIWMVKEQRPWGQRLFVYWAIISLGPILTGASLWASSVVLSESLGYIGNIGWFATSLLSYVPLLATIFGFTALFMFVPNRKVLLRDAFTGAVLTAICLELLKRGFALYLSKFPTYTLIYGAFATIPIFLLWVYISWLVALLGASFTATLPEFRNRKLHHLHAQGAPFLTAVNTLAILWVQRGQCPVGVSSAEISRQLHVDIGAITHVLYSLKRIAYAANTQVGEEEHWVFSCDPSTATLGPVVDALLLDRSIASTAISLALVKRINAALVHDGLTLDAFFTHPDTQLTISKFVDNSQPAALEAKEFNNVKSE